MINLPEPVAVVCHDAGAANIILAEIREHSRHGLLLVMQGPAAQLWAASGGRPETLYTLEQALNQARSVISGTGWASDLEHEARRGARARGLPSVAVIDHWVNYAARFEREGEVILPDELWVVDDYAFALASQSFPGRTIRQRPNLYLQAQVQAIREAGTCQPGRVLYLLEPIRYVWPGLQQPGEFEALDYLVRHISRLPLRERPTLRLRPHPSDPSGKYAAWIGAQTGIDTALDTAPTLAEAIASADWVAGCETAALAIALAAGKSAVSTLPPDAPRCRLPQADLVHLHQLVETLGGNKPKRTTSSINANNNGSL